jgi:hypothetical protein
LRIRFGSADDCQSGVNIPTRSRGDWHTKIPVLAHLSFVEQRALHDYFAFTKPLSEREALAHRKAVSTQDRSLPHRAGKAMKRFTLLSSIDWAEERCKQQASGHKPEHRKTVQPLISPEPNPEAIADVILAQILTETDREQGRAV